MTRFNVSNKCIGCRACVEVANSNFDIEDNKAYLKKQPETEKELLLCKKAENICPVKAIHEMKKTVTEPVLASSNVKETLETYPELKEILLNLSPKFKRLQNPLVYNTLARFANFNDAARMTGLSVCEILHTINKHIGTEERLRNRMPECIKTVEENIEKESKPITWQESNERYIYNESTLEELAQKIKDLTPQENIVIISTQKPIELMKIAKGLNMLFNIEQKREYRLSIFNPAKEIKTDWKERKDTFEKLDVRKMKDDPFNIIIKKAYELKEDMGFILIQYFEPHPLINMLTEMGFEHITEKKKFAEVWVYFYKKPQTKKILHRRTKKTEVVIQSATPVAYPVIMRLLQSKKLQQKIAIKELKVWEETEKHLAWITTGKADISFSALITSIKLSSLPIKIPAIFVWDNFVLLTRYSAKGFKDIKGKEIHLPLFEEAPPGKITKYLIKAQGLNLKDFSFIFGEPFGRPEQIYNDFTLGKADTVVLREPEASYAIKIMQDRKEEISIIPFNKIWNEINPNFGSFPNAGIVINEEFIKNHPDEANLFIEELKKAIAWVSTNKKEAAKLSFDIMRQPIDRIELFLERVHFEYVEGNTLIEKVKQYFSILEREKIIGKSLDKDFYKIFKRE